jgi:hypothetical protein
MCGAFRAPHFSFQALLVLAKRQSFYRGLIVSPHALQALEIRALDEKGLVAIPFPCQRTNASDWINTDLGTRVCMRPVRWRIWQKAKSPAPFDDAVDWRERLLLERKSGVHVRLDYSVPAWHT